jgi:ABC-type sulfate transport system permease component
MKELVKEVLKFFAQPLPFALLVLLVLLISRLIANNIFPGEGAANGDRWVFAILFTVLAGVIVWLSKTVIFPLLGYVYLEYDSALRRLRERIDRW